MLPNLYNALPFLLTGDDDALVQVLAAPCCCLFGRNKVYIPMLRLSMHPCILKGTVNAMQ